MKKFCFTMAALAMLSGCDTQEQSGDTYGQAELGVENRGGVISGMVEAEAGQESALSQPDGAEGSVVVMEQLESPSDDFRLMDEEQQARYEQVFGQFNMEEQPLVDKYLSGIAQLFAKNAGNIPLKTLLIDLDSISESNEFQVMDTFFVKLVEDDWERLREQGSLSESTAIFLEGMFSSEEYISFSRKIRGLKYEVLFPVEFDEAAAEGLSELWFMGSPVEMTDYLTLYSSKGNKKMIDIDSEQLDFPIILFGATTINQI